MTEVVGYSSLCETDKGAYLAYLLGCAFPLVKNDGSEEHYVGVDGRNRSDYAALLSDVAYNEGRTAIARAYASVVAPDSQMLRIGSVPLRSESEFGGGDIVGHDNVHVDGVRNRCVSDNEVGEHGSVGEDLGCVKQLNSGDQVSDNNNKNSDSGVSEVKASTLANRKKRMEKKLRKQRKRGSGISAIGEDDVPLWRRNAGVMAGRENGSSGEYRSCFSQCTDEVKRELAETRAQRYIAENKASVRKAQADIDSWERTRQLKQVKEEFQLEQAKQKLQLINAVDVEKLKKKNEVKLMKETEVARVAVEKAFGTLSATGNVAGAYSAAASSNYESGTVKTVASGDSSGVRSGTISPNSSISEAEVRKLQKDFLDVKKSNDEMVSAMRMLRTAVTNDDFKSVKDIVTRDYQAMYEQSAGFTMDTELDENRDEEDSGYIDKRGRFHFGIPPPVFEYDFDD